MKLEAIIKAAKECLEVRFSQNSHQSRAIHADAVEFLDGLITSDADRQDIILSLIRKAGENVGFIPIKEKLEKLFLNGADNWTHYSWSGCGRCYYYDIKEHYLPPSVAKRVTRQYKGQDLLDYQAAMLMRSAMRARSALAYVGSMLNNGALIVID